MPRAAQATAPFLDSTREGVGTGVKSPTGMGIREARCPFSKVCASGKRIAAGCRAFDARHPDWILGGCEEPAAHRGQGLSRSYGYAFRPSPRWIDSAPHNDGPFPCRVEEGRGGLGRSGHRSVSLPRSSNRTCGLPASGFPTGFIPRHTAATPGEPGAAEARRDPRTRSYRRTAWCRATAPCDA